MRISEMNGQWNPEIKILENCNRSLRGDSQISLQFQKNSLTICSKTTRSLSFGVSKKEITWGWALQVSKPFFWLSGLRKSSTFSTRPWSSISQASKLTWSPTSSVLLKKSRRKKNCGTSSKRAVATSSSATSWEPSSWPRTFTSSRTWSYSLKTYPGSKL